MAHPCDYYEKSTYSNYGGNRSKLKMSPSTMNRTPIKLSSPADKTSMKDSHAYILASNFIRENETWAISSAYDYCLKYYGEFGLTKEIFALAMHDYILLK